MRNGRPSSARSWSNMDHDILVRIFMTLNVMDVISSVSLVCSSWHTACCDPILWKTLDLSTLKTDAIYIPPEPYTWADEESSEGLLKIMKSALNLSRGSVTCLVFNYLISINDAHLVSAAERTPNLKRLILPATWNEFTEKGVFEAFKMWKGLKSLTVPYLSAPFDVMEAIGTFCKNLTELKLLCFFNLDFAIALSKNAPKLKVLSLRGTMVHNKALDYILDNFEHLEVLNISHCLFKHVNDSAVCFTLYRDLDRSIGKKGSRLKEFLICQKDSCILCKRKPYDELSINWCEFQQRRWKDDEVSSLEH